MNIRETNYKHSCLETNRMFSAKQNEKSKPVFYSTRDINSTVSMKKSGSDPLLSYHNVNLCLLVLP